MRINEINLNENPNIEKDILSEKYCVLDIKATLNSNIVCDIEMQVEDHENFEERMLFYWSKLYSKSLSSGNTYANLKKTISILILNFELIKLKSLSKFHSEWKILETECSNIVLTDYLEFHIISLEKLEQMIKNRILIKENSKLINWSKFLLDPDSLDKNVLKENREIAMAKEELEKFRRDEREVYLAELREKAILDENSRREYSYNHGRKAGYMDGKKEGKIEGRKEGRKEGIEEGIRESRIEIAKELLKLNVPIEQIIIATKLSKDELDKIV